MVLANFIKMTQTNVLAQYISKITTICVDVLLVCLSHCFSLRHFKLLVCLGYCFILRHFKLFPLKNSIFFFKVIIACIVIYQDVRPQLNQFKLQSFLTNENFPKELAVKNAVRTIKNNILVNCVNILCMCKGKMTLVMKHLFFIALARKVFQ